MKVHVVGFKSVDFTDEKGKRIVGTKIQCIHTPSEMPEGLRGQVATAFWTKFDCSNLPVDKDYDILVDITGSGKALITDVRPL